MKHVTIYTDGACSGNPGPGGWAAILIYGEFRREISGGEVDTTNNRMELMGVIESLEALKEPCKVSLFTDSKYVSDALNKGWLDSWHARGWKRKEGELKNPDLWKKVRELTNTHDVTMTWVKGHSDNEYNNRCDELAVIQRDKFAEA